MVGLLLAKKLSPPAGVLSGRGSMCGYYFKKKGLVKALIRHADRARAKEVTVKKGGSLSGRLL